MSELSITNEDAQAPQLVTADSKRPGWLLSILVLCGCTWLAYHAVVSCGFIWDDNDYVYENKTLTDVDGLKRIWLDPSATPQYYPLVHSSFWIEHQLWGMNPGGYHVVNVCLHLLNAILLWRLLLVLKVSGALLVALLFAVHPVHVESVAWITERKNVLSGSFYLLAFLVYLRNDRTWCWKNYGLAMLLFVCALLSKTVTATLPAAIAVVIWWKHGRVTATDALRLIPFFVVGIGLGILTVLLETHQVGAKGTDWDFSFADRVLIAGRCLWFYAAKLVWPYPLTFTYDRWTIDDTVLWQYLFPLAAIALIVILWLNRQRLSRGPLAAVLLFAGTLFPALGFFNVYPMRFSFVADHFQYLASIGLITFGGAMLARWIEFVGPTSKTDAGTIFARFAASAIVAALMILTWRQTLIYQGLEPLWRDTLAKNSTSWMAHNNLGTLLNKRHDYAEAIDHLKLAVELKPDYYEAYANLGKSQESLGDLVAAEVSYQRSLALEPKFATAHNGMGVIYAQRGAFQQALDALHLAIQLNPKYPEAYSNLGGVLFSMQRLAPAIEAYRTALALDPTLDVVRANLGIAWIHSGRFADAEKVLLESIERQPNDVSVQMNLGVAYANQQKYALAISRFETVLQLDPNKANAYQGLAVAYEGIGDKENSSFYMQRFQALQGTTRSK